MKKKAFTLVELLVVILILAFIISIVAPTGYKLYNNVLSYIQKKELQSEKKELEFNAFLMQIPNDENNITMLGVNYQPKTSSSNNH